MIARMACGGSYGSNMTIRQVLPLLVIVGVYGSFPLHCRSFKGNRQGELVQRSRYPKGDKKCRSKEGDVTSLPREATGNGRSVSEGSSERGEESKKIGEYALAGPRSAGMWPWR
jgi:hypothetical protein